MSVERKVKNIVSSMLTRCQHCVVTGRGSGDDLAIRQVDVNEVAVRCDDCGLTGPNSVLGTGAMERWNELMELLQRRVTD